jgi:hypothetical protein
MIFDYPLLLLLAPVAALALGLMRLWLAAGV